MSTSRTVGVDVGTSDRMLAEKSLVAAGALAITAGTLSAAILVGWWFDIALLTRGWPGTVAVKANTALGFGLASFGVLVAVERARHPRATRFGVVLALAVALVGALTLLEYATGLDLGIDQMLVHELRNSGDRLAPGRMSPMTAFALLATGIALLPLYAKGARAQIHSQGPALVAAFTGFLSALGHLYSVRPLYTLAPYVEIAPLTTLLSLMVPAGVLLASPHIGLVGLARSRTAGGLLLRRALPFALLLPPILGALRLAAERAHIIEWELGAALLVIANVAIFGAVLWLSACRLARQDVERRSAIAALEQSEERLRLTVDGIRGYALYLLDQRGRVQTWSAEAERLTGYATEEVLGRDFSMSFAPEHVSAGVPQKILTQAVAARRDELECWRVRKDGTRYWGSVALSSLQDQAGELRGFVVVSRDMTEEKRAQVELRAYSQKLADSERRYRDIVNALPLLAWTTGPDGKCDFLNRRWIDYTGIADPAQLGYEWFACVHHDDRDRATSAWKAAVEHGTQYEMESRIQAADGSYRWFKTRAVKFGDTTGVAKWFGSSTDIESQKRSEESLQRTLQNLARSNKELEQFASVASHDLQEPLRKIRAFGDRLAAKEAERLGADGLNYLERMRSAAARMQELIENLLAYARVTSKARPFSSVDLGAVAREAAADLEGRVRETHGSIEIGWLPTIEADDLQMQQVFQNLLANSLKFHRPDVPPVVRIDGRLVPSGPANGAATNSQCEIRVQDNGLGFEQEYAERIFGLFQRLHGRSEFEGTGLGLAICRKIVERHHGRIVGQSTPQAGATFTITLPTRLSQQEAQVS